MSATDELCNLLDERGVEYEAYRDIKNRCITKWRTYHGAFVFFAVEKEGKLFVETASGTEHSAICTPDQAIAATLSRPKAKAHPYGYEPDTGAFDCTRCECGCINDISATYCNDCGGEIEIDMYAEKEIYHIPCHLVFAEKHDDGSIEFGGKRYVAATLGEQPAKSGADALSRRARDMARNIQGNLGRCLYRRKDVAEMEEVSETLMELVDALETAAARCGRWWAND